MSTGLHFCGGLICCEDEDVINAKKETSTAISKGHSIVRVAPDYFVAVSAFPFPVHLAIVAKHVCLQRVLNKLSKC